MSKSPNFLSLYLGLLVYFIQEPFNYWDKKREFRETPVLFCAIVAFLFSAFAKSLSSFPAPVAFSFCCADSKVKQTKRGAECLISKVAPAMHCAGWGQWRHTQSPFPARKTSKISFHSHLYLCTQWNAYSWLEINTHIPFPFLFSLPLV